MRVTSIVKVAGWDCDMRCGYCYYNIPRFENVGRVMPLSVVDKVCALQIAATDTDSTTMIWHGGEPLLVGIEYYEEVISIQKKHERLSGIRIDNKMQTNGLGITDEWVEFFLRNNIKPGLSIDGPADIHDAYRVDISGEGTHARIMQNVTMLHDAGISFGCIAVLTDKVIGREQDMFDFFVEAGIKNVKVKPCYAINEKTEEVLPFSISPKEYGKFLVGLFNAWIDHDDPNVTIGPLADALRGLMGKKVQQCVFKRNCAQFWSVWPDGDLYQCEYHLEEDAYIGNILRDTPDDLQRSHAGSLVLQRINEPMVNCTDCEWNHFCKGGCSRFDVGLDLPTNMYCTSTKMLFSHVAKYLEKC